MDIIKIPITPTIIPNNHNESDSFLFINPKYINTLYNTVVNSIEINVFIATYI